MKTAKTIIAIILGLFLLFGAYGHVSSPEISDGFIPEFLPKPTIHILTAIVEAGLGILTLIPTTRRFGLTGIFILMILFLPLHIIDYFRDTPVIGTKTAALIRILVQFFIIFLAWFANKQKLESNI